MSSEGRARIGLAALLLLTLLAFAQVFSSGNYPGPALLAMALASGIAIASRRLGAGTATTVLASLVTLLVYLVVVFQARNSFFLLPSPDAVAGLGRSISNALRHSAVDYAPVPVRTGYVVLVVTGMWVATTIGEIATFRWRRPLLAALPCIGLFCLQMTVGTGNGAPVLVIAFLLALLTYWGLESAHRVRSWGRWVPAFAGREGREPESVTGALARRMGAGCLAAAVVAPLIVPALGDGLLAWRNDVGAGGFGGGGSGEINPLVSIAPQLLEQTDSVLFTVQAERSTYWRLLSLARFDGRDWERVDGATEEVTDGASFAGQSNSPRSAEPLEQTFTFEDLESERLPAAINPAEVDLEEDVELTYDTENQDLVLPDDATEGFSYTVTSNTPELTYDELTEAQTGATEAVYTQAPDATLRTMELAEDLRVDRVTGERLSAGQFLIALQEELRTKFEYSDDPELVEATRVDGASADYLDDFLFEVRRGYCQQFATAFALLARLQGIPTRVAVGFLPGSRDTQTDTFTVTGVETHAWPEVFFEDYGWIRFDPTPRVQASAPGYTREALEPGGPGGGGGGGEGVAGAISRQEQIRDRRLAGQNVGAGLIEGEQAIGGDFAPGAAVPENPAWTRAFNRLAAAVAALLLAFLASVPALKRWRIARRYRSARGADESTTAAFRHFEDEAAELAEPRRPAESAASFAFRLAKLRAVPSDDAARLARIYEASQYGPDGVGKDQARQARVLARKLRGAMWARASWWTRAARLFSPRGLVGRS